MSRSRRHLRTVLDEHYAECPRCGAMAQGLTTDSGEIFAVDCSACGLPGATSVITLWSRTYRKRVPCHSLDLQDAVFVMKSCLEEVEVWEGDVLVAVRAANGTITYLAGRCAP